MYADELFYKNEYQGVDVEEAQLTKLLKRAGRDIDSLTGFRLRFNKLNESNQLHVKNAVCAQVEFLVENGETASTVSDGGGSFSIGSYSESSTSKGSTSSQKPQRYAASVKDYLFPTGLLYAGVHRHG